MKSQPGGSLPLAASNFRIQSKDVLRLPPSSITTDAKGQTVLRITPDMMATLAKSQVTTVKLTQDLFAAAGGASAGKGISATLHVTSSPIQPSDSPAKTSTPTASVSASPLGPTVVKVTPDLKTVESTGSAFRLMPALGMAVAEQKGKTLATMASAEAKPAATIRIVQGVGMMPPKAGQTITVATHAKQMPSSSAVSLPGAVHTSAVSLPAMTASVSKAVAVVSGAAGTPITLGAGTSTMRQLPVSTTVVSTTQAVRSVPRAAKSCLSKRSTLWNGCHGSVLLPLWQYSTESGIQCLGSVQFACLCPEHPQLFLLLQFSALKCTVSAWWNRRGRGDTGSA